MYNNNNDNDDDDDDDNNKIEITKNLFVFALPFNCEQVEFECRHNHNHRGTLKRIYERTSGSIYCPYGTTIDILSANYGRTTGRHICPDPAINTNCRSSGSLSKVREKCQGERYCYLEAVNSVFGDPCQGTKKYLEVRILKFIGIFFISHLFTADCYNT